MKVTTPAMWHDMNEGDEITYIDPISGERVVLGTYTDPTPIEEDPVSYDPTEDTGSFETKAFSQTDFERALNEAKTTTVRQFTPEEYDRFIFALKEGYDQETGDTLYNFDKAALGILLYGHSAKYGITFSPIVKRSAEIMKELNIAEESSFHEAKKKWAMIFYDLGQDQVFIKPFNPEVTFVKDEASMKSQKPALTFEHPFITAGLIPRR